ncbi:MAG: hypothetical protein HPY83_02755 [Anaerolineae bacterium]|nr:hypothetical protein [Anaerolineae bacterium]
MSELWAGAAKVDVTGTASGAANDRLYVRALALKNSATAVVIVSLDAVAIGEIGPVADHYLPGVRSRLQKELGIAPTHVLVSASHCHGIVCDDVEERTIQAIREAWRNLEPVHVGVGAGHEDRIQENRRFRLRNGREADARRAYALPPDDEVIGVGPIDPQIGILRLDRATGQTLAVVYNFACHPIQGVPSEGNTADLTGFASAAIERSLGEGAIALFLQGCAGDVNPALYKGVDAPKNAEVLGSLLGLSTLAAIRQIRTRPGGSIELISEMVELPTADLSPHIEALRAEQLRLLGSLEGTNLNLRTFVYLMTKHRLFPDFPSYYSYGYLHEEQIGREHLRSLDAENRREMEKYLRNVHVMEQLTRVQTNLALLEKHRGRIAALKKGSISVEVAGLRVGEWVLITFPGELSVQIGLNIKRASPHRYTFVSGCTNGYIYYAPTADQLANRGGAQEDSDCVLAPEWQSLFEGKAAEILSRL